MTKTEMLNRLYQVKVSIRATLVLNYLINRANVELTCFPAIKTIAKDCNMSARTVQRALNDLLEAGLIEKNSRFRDNGGQSSNLFTLCLDIGHCLSGEDENILTGDGIKVVEGNLEDSDAKIEISEVGFMDYGKSGLIDGRNSDASSIKLPVGHKAKNTGVDKDRKHSIDAFAINICQGVGDNLVPP